MPSARICLRTSLIACLLTAAVARAAEPRPIELTVDATDAPRGVFHSRLTIPAAPGELTLAYPKWVQGEHAPSGPVTQVAGFTVSAAGKALVWRRDPLDMFLVRVEVPAGAREVEVDFDYLSPPEAINGLGYGETPNCHASPADRRLARSADVSPGRGHDGDPGARGPAPAGRLAARHGAGPRTSEGRTAC